MRPSFERSPSLFSAPELVPLSPTKSPLYSSPSVTLILLLRFIKPCLIKGFSIIGAKKGVRDSDVILIFSTSFTTLLLLYVLNKRILKV